MKPTFDNQASLRAARDKFGGGARSLEALMAADGYVVVKEACPFCKNKTGATLKVKNGLQWFKCFHGTCPSGTSVDKGAWNDLRYLGWKLGLAPKEAFVAFLKLAGVFQEPPKASERQSAQSSKREDAPRPDVPDTPDAPTPHDPDDADPPEGNDPESWYEAQHAKSDRRRELLEEFYQMLTLTPQDVDAVWKKRGLLATTLRLLGVVSSTTGEAALKELSKEFPMQELVDAGWWMYQEGKVDPRPNRMFCGYGIIGKKPKAERKTPKDKFRWGFCNPILIPYFDNAGNIIALRPHKGGLAGEMPRLYIPRAIPGLSATDESKAEPASTSESPTPPSPESETEPEKIVKFPAERKLFPERFRSVIVTEGELKAMALWQQLGLGRYLTWQTHNRKSAIHPWGVCALPGITMSNHFGVRSELLSWLKEVGAEKVYVAFDNEDKASLRLPDGSENPAFEPDFRERMDAEIWSNYLVCTLERELHVEAFHVDLPVSWRDAKGKADWDGALAGALGSSKRKQEELCPTST